MPADLFCSSSVLLVMERYVARSGKTNLPRCERLRLSLHPPGCCSRSSRLFPTNATDSRQKMYICTVPKNRTGRCRLLSHRRWGSKTIRQIETLNHGSAPAHRQGQRPPVYEVTRQQHHWAWKHFGGGMLNTQVFLFVPSCLRYSDTLPAG